MPAQEVEPLPKFLKRRNVGWTKPPADTLPIDIAEIDAPHLTAAAMPVRLHCHGIRTLGYTYPNAVLPQFFRRLLYRGSKITVVNIGPPAGATFKLVFINANDNFV